VGLGWDFLAFAKSMAKMGRNCTPRIRLLDSFVSTWSSFALLHCRLDGFVCLFGTTKFFHCCFV
jgi:hypothetical protein